MASRPGRIRAARRKSTTSRLLEPELTPTVHTAAAPGLHRAEAMAGRYLSKRR